MNANIIDAAADEFKKNPVGVLAGATAILLFVSAFFRSIRSFWVKLGRRESSPREQAPIQQVVSPTMSQTFNPTINIQLPDTNPIETAVPATTKAISGPGFKFTGTRERYVFISPYADMGVRKVGVDREARATGQALVFKFESEGVPRATDVVAKLSFRSADGVTEQAIDYGVWLDSSINCTDIDVGDTRELLVCVVDENMPFALDDHRELNHKYHGDATWFDARTINGLELLEIRLVDGRTGATKTFNFRVWRDKGHFYVA